MHLTGRSPLGRESQFAEYLSVNSVVDLTTVQIIKDKNFLVRQGMLQIMFPPQGDTHAGAHNRTVQGLIGLCKGIQQLTTIHNNDLSLFNTQHNYLYSMLITHMMNANNVIHHRVAVL